MALKIHVPFRYKIYRNFITVLLVCFFVKINAQSLLYDTLNIKVRAVKSVNTTYSEYSPFVFNKQFYFVSDRESDLFVKGTEKSTNQSFSHLFKGKLNDSLTIEGIQVAKEEAVSKSFIGSSCETELGYYYTTNNFNYSRSNKSMKLQINFIEKVNGKKNKEPIKITFGLNDTISCVHPTVVNDTLIIFASDWQENSRGKIDLFYSIKKNNEWQKPINCGITVNSASNESFPFWCNGILYFSSDRVNGFGALDIYKTNWTDKQTQASILPYPINSPFDDFGVAIDLTSQKGYFSSNRNGNDDIYYFTNVAQEITNCEEMKNNYYCYTFYEEAALVTKDTVGVTYEWSFGNNIKKRGIEVKHCFEREGKYLVKLNVIDKTSGEEFYNLLSYTFDLRVERQLYIHSPDSAKTFTEMVFDPSYSNIANLNINRYYWDFGDGTLSYDKTPKHVYTKDGEYTVKFAIDGFFNGEKVKKCVTKKVIINSSVTRDVYLFNLPKTEDTE